MKKILTFILATLIAFSAAGCKNVKDDKTNEKDNQTKVEDTAAKEDENKDSEDVSVNNQQTPE